MSLHLHVNWLVVVVVVLLLGEGGDYKGKASRGRATLKQVPKARQDLLVN